MSHYILSLTGGTYEHSRILSGMSRDYLATGIRAAIEYMAVMLGVWKLHTHRQGGTMTATIKPLAFKVLCRLIVVWPGLLNIRAIHRLHNRLFLRCLQAHEAGEWAGKF